MSGVVVQGPSDGANTPSPSLASFIFGNMEIILQDWEDFARSLSLDETFSQQTLRDHAKEILHAVAIDMERPQSPQTQEDKSMGLLPDNSPALQLAGEQHALARIVDQFDVEQLIAEYRALRGSVLRRWAAEKPVGAARYEEMTRFNESIDEALMASARHYARKNDEARDVILGVLAHDLRNPLHVAQLSASYILLEATSSAKCIQAAARIKASIRRCDHLVSDLIDYAMTKLGQGIPMTPRDGDMRHLCATSIDEIEAANPGRVITPIYAGDLKGRWDASRISQLLGNLLTNALKHGGSETPITLTATGAGDTVSVEIHNDGPCIAPTALALLFEPLYLQRGLRAGRPEGSSGLGLGLYIWREIAHSHSGEIGVSSSPEFGTSFTLVLPRESPPHTRRETAGHGA